MNPGASKQMHGWTIESQRSPIMKTAEMEAFQAQYEMPSLPEMIHGAAFVRFKHNESGVEICFNALDALVEWRKHCFERPAPKVANHKDWKEERAETLVDIPSMEYDWTFHSEYTGTVKGAELRDATEKEHIPYERLKRQEEIVMWEQQVLMEDELADNGCCIQTVRLRVMPSGFFCLHRLFMRLDGVEARVCDTRLYHAFGEQQVLLEKSIRHNTFAELLADGRLPLKDPSQIADENLVCELLDKRQTTNFVIPVPAAKK